MSDSASSHPTTTSAATRSADRRRRHRRDRPGRARGVRSCRPQSGYRLTRLTGAGSSASARVGGRLLGLHALPRRAELPRPRQQRKIPKADAHQLGVSGSQLQAAQQACRHRSRRRGAINSRARDTVHDGRRLSTGPGAALMNGLRTFAAVHALARGAQLARPDHRFRGAPSSRSASVKPASIHIRRRSWPRCNACSHLMRGLPGAPPRSRRRPMETEAIGGGGVWY